MQIQSWYMLKKMLDFELNLDVDEDRIRAIILFVLCDVTQVLDWIRRVGT